MALQILCLAVWDALLVNLTNTADTQLPEGSICPNSFDANRLRTSITRDLYKRRSAKLLKKLKNYSTADVIMLHHASRFTWRNALQDEIGVIYHINTPTRNSYTTFQPVPIIFLNKRTFSMTQFNDLTPWILEELQRDYPLTYNFLRRRGYIGLYAISCTMVGAFAQHYVFVAISAPGMALAVDLLKATYKTLKILNMVGEDRNYPIIIGFDASSDKHVTNASEDSSEAIDREKRDFELALNGTEDCDFCKANSERCRSLRQVSISKHIHWSGDQLEWLSIGTVMISDNENATTKFKPVKEDHTDHGMAPSLDVPAASPLLKVTLLQCDEVTKQAKEEKCKWTKLFDKECSLEVAVRLLVRGGVVAGCVVSVISISLLEF